MTIVELLYSNRKYDENISLDTIEEAIKNRYFTISDILISFDVDKDISYIMNTYLKECSITNWVCASKQSNTWYVREDDLEYNRPIYVEMDIISKLKELDSTTK